MSPDTYTPNALGELTDLVNKTSGGTTLTDFGDMPYNWTWDRTAVTASVPGYTGYSGTTDYSYDNITGIGTREQLTEEASTRNGDYTNYFQYDSGSYTASTGAGDPTEMRGTTQAFNSDNQITSPSSFTYDGDGCPTTYKGTTVHYDTEGRMTLFGSVSGSGESSAYFATGQRAWKQNSGGVQYYVYDGLDPVSALHDGGTWSNTFTFGAYGLLSSNQAAGSTFYIWDQHGNLAQRLNSSQSVLTDHIFDAFGDGSSNTSFTDHWLFGGQYGYYTDSETGFALAGLRYYDATIGRWTTADPAGFLGGANQYSYVANDAETLVDPAGLWDVGPIVTGGGATGNGGIGAGGSANAGGGIFWGPNGTNTGGFAGAGGFAGGGTGAGAYGPTYPGSNGYRGAIGTSVGAGVGVFLTNAPTPGRLGGAFQTITLSTPIGGIDFSWSGGIGIVTLTWGTRWDASLSTYPSNTWSPGSVGTSGTYLPRSEPYDPGMLPACQ